MPSIQGWSAESIVQIEAITIEDGIQNDECDVAEHGDDLCATPAAANVCGRISGRVHWMRYVEFDCVYWVPRHVSSMLLNTFIAQFKLFPRTGGNDRKVNYTLRYVLHYGTHLAPTLFQSTAVSKCHWFTTHLEW